MKRKKWKNMISIYFKSIYCTYKVFLRGRIAYRTAFISELIGIAATVLFYFFLGSSIKYQRGISYYGTESPLAFILSGMLLEEAFKPLRYNFPLAPEVFYMTLSSPKPLLLDIIQLWLGIYSYYFIITFAYSFVLLTFCPVNVDLLTLIIFILNMIVMSIGLNIITNGVRLIVKKGDPVGLAFKFSEYLLSGRNFPVTIMPIEIQVIAWIFPQSWAQLVWRKVLFSRLSYATYTFCIFTMMSLVTFIVGLLLLRIGINKLYREGVLL
ncbi:MAG: hypothetical protein NDF54_11655 [archaeon GB-1867-035]|nr:hypothetical protein [Candidatus Culexmicrobium profundum]